MKPNKFVIAAVTLLILFVLVALGAIGVSAYGRMAFQGEAARFASPLTRTYQSTPPAVSPDLLPPPVADYLAKVFEGNVRRIKTASLTIQGGIVMEAGRGGAPMNAQKTYRVSGRPGFIWSGQVTSTPLVWIGATELYIEGSGLSRAEVFGVYRLANLVGGETDVAQLARLFVEAAWIPSILAEPYVTWTGYTVDTATGTITDGERSFTATFHFDRNHLLRSVTADAHPHFEGERYVMRPWRGEYKKYVEHGGVLIPEQGFADWVIDGKSLRYLGEEVTSAHYLFMSGNE
jgi:hypothetical protein